MCQFAKTKVTVPSHLELSKCRPLDGFDCFLPTSVSSAEVPGKLIYSVGTSQATAMRLNKIT